MQDYEWCHEYEMPMQRSFKLYCGPSKSANNTCCFAESITHLGSAFSGTYSGKVAGLPL